MGGIFYVIGGAVVAVAIGSLSGLGSDSNSLGILSGSLSGSSFNSLGYAVAGFGVISGILIIIGGLLFRYDNPGRRKVGGILVIVMLLVGGLATLGGLGIGFILVAIGAYLGLTYKSGGRSTVIGLGPVGSFTLGRSDPAPVHVSGPAGGGPLNYCIKCGSPIRQGAVFCGACGARVVD